jgi:putative glutathione S-transferase
LLPRKFTVQLALFGFFRIHDACSDEFPGADTDPVQNSNHMRDLYFKADPEYSGR